MKTWVGKVVHLILGISFVFHAEALTYTLHSNQQALIGKIQYGTAEHGDNVINLAKRFDLGFNAMKNVNPDLDLSRGFHAGTKFQIPSQHLLPQEPRKGIVINLPEMRMYYFTEDQKVHTYPIGIGKMGQTIPITRAKITRKATDPTWTPPDSIREFNLEQGIVLPQVMPPGPDNPLGRYAIYMSIPTYLIHSTIFPGSIGKRASFGCIRMYEDDIEEFFPKVKQGLPVIIINEPIKFAWEDNKLFIEAHEPLEEHKDEGHASLPGIVTSLANQMNENTFVDWQLLTYLMNHKDGIPHEVGFRMSP